MAPLLQEECCTDWGISPRLLRNLARILEAARPESRRRPPLCSSTRAHKARPRPRRQENTAVPGNAKGLERQRRGAAVNSGAGQTVGLGGHGGNERVSTAPGRPGAGPCWHHLTGIYRGKKCQVRGPWGATSVAPRTRAARAAGRCAAAAWAVLTAAGSRTEAAPPPLTRTHKP